MARATEAEDVVEGGLEIAIIGMNVRVPGAADPQALWENLRAGVESITFFSDAELDAAGVPAETIADPHYVKAFGALADVDRLDAAFFGLSPREAEALDPQHRLLLQGAWELLESGGHDPARFAGRIGVYAGVGLNTYLLNNLVANPQVTRAIGAWHVGMSNDKDFAPTRVSYKLGLTGPSVSVNTGCSTSLVAVAMGCQSLLNYQSDMVLAGGVTVQSPQSVGYWYHTGSVNSPDGHCRPFDANSQGTVDANGLALVLLKRLDDALEDGDCIHAIIKGSAINNDGDRKVGYTAPSVEGQAQVIAEAQTIAGVDADTITYVETHGTGTALGDSVELTALTQAFRQTTARKGFCALGSLKANVGHTDTAAGVASLIATVLAMQHRQLPPLLHFTRPNPEFDWDASPFYTHGDLRPWESPGPRRAGVSSFGIGGTNAHVIVEEAPPPADPAASRDWQVLPLSARTDDALERAGERLSQHLAAQPDLSLGDVAYTLTVGRRAFEHRRVLVAQNVSEAGRLLAAPRAQRVWGQVVDPQVERPVVFLLPGMGTEYMNMGLELYRGETAFREHVDSCAQVLKAREGLDFFQIWEMSGTQDHPPHLSAAIPRSQAPAGLFIVAYSLARMWMDHGVRPSAMLGYSGGEYVAACLAGVMSVENALSLVTASGRLTERLPEGSMLAVALPEDRVVSRLRDGVELAAVNGPDLCLVAGPPAALDQLQSALLAEGSNCYRLPVGLAYHSAAMEPIVEPLLELLRGVPLHAPSIPWVSSVTGTWVTDTEATSPEHYARQIVRQPVRFADGLGELFAHPESVLLEIGPGQVLSPLVMQHSGHPAEQLVLSTLKAPQYAHPEQSSVATSLAKLWLSGVPVDWESYYASEQRRRVPLPTYPFERNRYWVESSGGGESDATRSVPSGKRADMDTWFYLPSWHRSQLAVGETETSDVKPEDATAWLVLADEDGPGRAVCAELRAAGYRVAAVRRGGGFARLDADTYQVATHSDQDYRTLLAALREDGFEVARIVHAWLLGAPSESTDAEMDAGVHGLIALGTALGASGTTQLELFLLSTGMHDITGVEPLCPERAAAMGPLRVLPQEYPGIRTRSIDVLATDADAGPRQKLAQQLVAEMTAAHGPPTVALRGPHRWLRRFDPVSLDTLPASGSTLRERGVYLITGGLGHIGLALASRMARDARARLILVGRSEMPPRTAWDGQVAQHPDAPLSRRLRQLLELEQLGAEVMVARADVADESAVRDIVDRAEARFGPLNGVVHAAGLVGEASFRSIAETDLDYCGQHFQSKVHGTRVLERVLGDRDLDFCITVSSLSSLLGGLGFAAYAAGNLFMDAFVDRHNRQSAQHWTSANVEGWQFVTPDEGAGPAGSVAELAMLPVEGVEALERIRSVGSSVNQLVVSTGDLQARLEQWVDLAPAADQESSAHDRPRHARPDLLTPYQEPRDDVECQLVEMWEQVLGMGPIGIQDSFFELGGNSLLVTQLVAHIRSGFQFEVPLGKLFNEPRIADTADHIRALRTAAQLQQAEPDSSGDREEGVL